MHIFSGANRSLFHDRQHPKDLGGAEGEACFELVGERAASSASNSPASFVGAAVFAHPGIQHNPALAVGNLPPADKPPLARCAEPPIQIGLHVGLEIAISREDAALRQRVSG